MDGLYALKPWYAARLRAPRAALVARSVSPGVVTVAGVAVAAAGGVALATGHGMLVAPFALARLACANLDGNVARDLGRASRWGGVVNELGDRLADLALLAGAAFVAPVPLVLLALLASCLPSWVSLAGAAHGAPRLNGGPVGKTERALLASVAGQVTALLVPVLWLVVLGSAATAALRLARVRTALGSAA